MKYLNPSRRYRVMIVIARLPASARLRCDALLAHRFDGRLAVSHLPGGAPSLCSYAELITPLKSSVPSEWMILVKHCLSSNCV